MNTVYEVSPEQANLDLFYTVNGLPEACRLLCDRGAEIIVDETGRKLDDCDASELAGWCGKFAGLLIGQPQWKGSGSALLKKFDNCLHCAYDTNRNDCDRCRYCAAHHTGTCVEKEYEMWEARGDEQMDEVR